MYNFDITPYAICKHNPFWLIAPDPPCAILIKGSSDTEKTNMLLTFVTQQEPIDTIHFCVRDTYEDNYLFIINKQ